jgi:hypothetical protein
MPWFFYCVDDRASDLLLNLAKLNLAGVALSILFQFPYWDFSF